MAVPLIAACVVALLTLPVISALPFAPLILAQTQTRLAICPSIRSALWDTFRAEAVQGYPDGFTVYYTALCTNIVDALEPGEGFRTYRRGWLGWQDLGGEDVSYYDAGCINPAASRRAVCCSVSLGEEREYTAVFGRANRPDVALVEVAFANGGVGRMQVVNQKFAIANPSVAAWARLRAFDRNGRVLEDTSLDLSDDARAAGATGCVP